MALVVKLGDWFWGGGGAVAPPSSQSVYDDSTWSGPHVRPAHRAELIPKAYTRADAVILDLGDGAGEEDHDRMRETLRASESDPARTVLSTAAPSSPHFRQDVDVARELR